MQALGDTCASLAELLGFTTRELGAVTDAGYRRLRAGRIDEAEVVLRGAVGLFPFAPRPWRGLAACAASRGSWLQARRFAQVAALLDPPDAFCAALVRRCGVMLGEDLRPEKPTPRPEPSTLSSRTVLGLELSQATQRLVSLLAGSAQPRSTDLEATASVVLPSPVTQTGLLPGRRPGDDLDVEDHIPTRTVGAPGARTETAVIRRRRGGLPGTPRLP